MYERFRAEKLEEELDDTRMRIEDDKYESLWFYDFSMSTLLYLRTDHVLPPLPLLINSSRLLLLQKKLFSISHRHSSGIGTLEVLSFSGFRFPFPRASLL